MKQILFITATNTNVGKTYASYLILKKLAKQGFRVAYFKPIETGVINNKPQDILKCVKLAKKLNPNLSSLPIEYFYSNLYTLPACPFVASMDKDDKQNKQNKHNKNTAPKPKQIIKKALYLFNFCDILIVEGAGGLLVPLKKDYFIIDLIKKFSKINSFELCENINQNENINIRETKTKTKTKQSLKHIKNNYKINPKQNKKPHKLKTTTILISPSNLGNINDTLLSFNILKQYSLTFKWYINLFKQKKSFKKVSLGFYKAYAKISKSYPQPKYLDNFKLI